MRYNVDLTTSNIVAKHFYWRAQMKAKKTHTHTNTYKIQFIISLQWRLLYAFFGHIVPTMKCRIRAFSRAVDLLLFWAMFESQFYYMHIVLFFSLRFSMTHALHTHAVEFSVLIFGMLVVVALL